MTSSHFFNFDDFLENGLSSSLEHCYLYSLLLLDVQVDLLDLFYATNENRFHVHPMRLY